MCEETHEDEIYFIDYEINREDIGKNGIKAENVVYRRGIPYLKVSTTDFKVYSDCSRYLANDRKQEDRYNRCKFLTQYGNYARCNEKCSECLREFSRTLLSIDDVAKETPEALAITDEGFGIFETAYVVEEMMTKLKALNPMYADYLRRNFFEKESIEKIAKADGKAVNTVKEEMSRAKTKARKIIEGLL